MDRSSEILERALKIMGKYDMPIFKFCNRAGISYAAFYGWRKGTLRLSDATLNRIDGILEVFGV